MAASSLLLLSQAPSPRAPEIPARASYRFGVVLQGGQGQILSTGGRSLGAEAQNAPNTAVGGKREQKIKAHMGEKGPSPPDSWTLCLSPSHNSYGFVPPQDLYSSIFKGMTFLYTANETIFIFHFLKNILQIQKRAINQ